MMRNRSLRWRAFLVSMLSVLAFAGCADEVAGRGQRVESAEAAGSLTIPLIAYGGAYRFRLIDAAFEIKGPTNTFLAPDPDSYSARSRPLIPGNYTVRLLDGWRLQRETSEGFLEVEAQVLSSETFTFVQNGQSTSVTFRFQTFGEVIETGEGTIDVNVEVDLTDPVNPWRAVKVVSAYNHACAIADDETLHCWGEGSGGRLGYGDTQPRRIDQAGPVDVGGRVIDLALGSSHTCAVLEGGTVRCWGEGIDGRLGYGNYNSIGDDEVPASAGDVDVGGSVKQITAGAFHTCALLESGRLRCWGWGWPGSLGYGNRDSVGGEQTPAAVGELDLFEIAEVRAVGPRTCARDLAGGVRCWGYNENYAAQIGDDEPASFAPVITFAAPATQLAMSGNHYCVALANDEVACVSFSSSAYPEGSYHLSGGTLGAPIRELGVGNYHNCALLDSGSVRCWGFNYGGLLGNDYYYAVNATEAAFVPLAEPVSDLSVNEIGSCAVDFDGRVRCWPRRPLVP